MDAGPALDEETLRRITGLVAAVVSAPGPAGLGLEYHEVLAQWQEVRLRFNAPTPVDAWTLRLAVATPDGQRFSGEIELFHWLEDDEWELWHSALAPSAQGV